VVRLLDMRGLYHACGGPPGPVPAHVFGGMPVSFATLATNPVHALLIPRPGPYGCWRSGIRGGIWCSYAPNIVTGVWS
jgi:hypothetical protein